MNLDKSARDVNTQKANRRGQWIDLTVHTAPWSALELHTDAERMTGLFALGRKGLQTFSPGVGVVRATARCGLGRLVDPQAVPRERYQREMRSYVGMPEGEDLTQYTRGLAASAFR